MSCEFRPKMQFEQLNDLESVLNGHVNGQIVDQVVTKLTAAGENYMSLILKVQLKIKNSVTNKEENIIGIAKLVPPAFVKTELMFIAEVTFKNELRWYDKILPIFEKFEEENDVKGLFTDIYPKFYGGRLSLDPNSQRVDKDALVVLEYLEGYENDNRHIGFDYPTTKEIIKALAKFHAIPIAIKLREPEVFKTEVLPNLTKIAPPPKDDKKFPDPTPRLFDILKTDPETQKLLPRCEEPLKAMPFGDSERIPNEPWATIAHKDFWVNNIMLKRDQKNAGTIKIKIVDFQGLDYASFAQDLVFLLLLSVQQAVLEQHSHEFIKLYYDFLMDYLTQLKVDTDQFKYEDYLEELVTECKKSQFAHAMVFANVVFREKGPNAGPDTVFDENPDNFKKFMTENASEKQVEKVKEIAKFCAKMDWI